MCKCLRHSNNRGLGNYSRNFTGGELRTKSIIRNLLAPTYRMDLGLPLDAMIARWGWMTIFHYFTRQTTDDNPWLSSKNGKRLEICCFESNGADKLKRTFWGSENDKNWLMVVIADDNGVNLSETGTKHSTLLRPRHSHAR